MEGNALKKKEGPLTVVSLGLRGEYSEARIREGLTRLEGWLAENAASYERAGDRRLLAYNSPMVPGPRKYSEIQIPVRKLQGTAEATLQTRSF